MKVRRIPLVVVAGVFALMLNIYIFVHVLINRSDTDTHGKLSADDCVDTDVQAKTNPNKMLFTSCGGFLE